MRNTSYGPLDKAGLVVSDVTIAVDYRGVDNMEDLRHDAEGKEGARPDLSYRLHGE